MVNDGGRYSIISYVQKGKFVHEYTPNGHIKNRKGFPEFISELIEKGQEPKEFLDIKNFHEEFLTKCPNDKSIESKVKLEIPKGLIK
jgi:hypothetical protein